MKPMELKLGRIRLVIHHQISVSDVQHTLSCIQQAVTGGPTENGDRAIQENFHLGIALPRAIFRMRTRPRNALPKPEEVRTYIIQVDYTQRPEAFSTDQAWDEDILDSINSNPAIVEKILVYSYSHVMHGFSARLTVSQLSQLERHPIRLATFQESFGRLLTTHSTRYMAGCILWKKCDHWVFDTGIWPESESFSDSGISPIPGRWKGTCENGTDFSSSLCNKKLIGARAFNKGFLAAGGRIRHKDFNSTGDFDGHGTDTSSTAAGNHALALVTSAMLEAQPKG
ncbi:hypothetical protein RJ639_024318 [Escallonia herrerae]|uniref:Inhibitor I9 domain-containing protein n=1 Tax=Escallonia herrerae TaxID=1293975 RepID=A0AA89AD25_9ASTE|nr:hypothetical protein RJ639_024318 [Escallonia herrerae]